MKKLLSSPEKSTAGRSAFLSSVTASVALIICCAILMTGATWAWWTASTAVKTDVIRTANYETIVKVINNKTGEEVTPNDDGSYDLDKNIRYTVTITPDPDTTTASTGFATFSVDDVDFDENGETDTFHTVQIAPGDSVWFDIVGDTSLKDIVANWATSSTPDIVPDDPNPVNPVFEGDPRFVKTPVKLVPTDENSTAMIERDGVVETWNTGLAATPYGVTEIIEPNEYGYDADSFDTYYVYGLNTRLTEAELADYVKVQGNGHYEITLSSMGAYGTGAVINVIDDSTGETVERFYIIIFGDLNGDALITTTDTNALISEVKDTEWSGENKTDYLVKAADLNLDGLVTSTDTAAIINTVKESLNIDQKSGLASN